MFLAVMITFLMTVFLMLALFLMDENQKLKQEQTNLAQTNQRLERQILTSRDMEHFRRERSAYDKGLYDGRQTDTLYRNVLKRYSAKEQVGVMMNGESERLEDRRRTRS